MERQCTVCLETFKNSFELQNDFRCCAAVFCTECQFRLKKCPACRYDPALVSRVETLVKGSIDIDKEQSQILIKRMTSIITTTTGYRRMAAVAFLLDEYIAYVPGLVLTFANLS